MKGGAEETCWSDETLYHEGADYFQALISEIRLARKTIDLQVYIFNRDRLGLEILDELRQAAGRGVRVRLLLDGFGCVGWNFRQAASLAAEGVDVRFYHPLPWQSSGSRLYGLTSLNRVLESLQKINRRNHRKLCVIDGQTAFAGGMNISALQSSRHHDLAWRDTSVRVTGPAVADIEAEFERLWPKVHPVSEARTLARLVRFNSNPVLRHGAHRDLIDRIRGATRRVWITTPYFIPDPPVIHALCDAAKKGVDVRLLLPRMSDAPFVQWLSRAYYPTLLHRGVKIHEYSPRILHAKTLLIDDWAVVGSSNMNQRSLLHDLESDIVLTREKSIEELASHFLHDLESSRQAISPPPSRPKRVAGRLLKRLSRFLEHWA